MEPSAWLNQVRLGDELAWEAFVRQHQGRVFGLAYHYVGNRDEGRDLAQEVFIRVYQHLDRIPPEDGLLPWLMRITRNACLDHLRRRSARPPLWDLPVEEQFDLRAQGLDPEEQHLDDLRRATVHRALQDLTDLNREIIVLKEIQGLALEDIARMLEVPLGTVKSRSHRARLELAQRLTALGAGPVPVPG
jgi:RNA polymerase sigma-70 factor (ECF subfamily)